MLTCSAPRPAAETPTGRCEHCGACRWRHVHGTAFDCAGCEDRGWVTAVNTDLSTVFVSFHCKNPIRWADRFDPDPVPAG